MVAYAMRRVAMTSTVASMSSAASPSVVSRRALSNISALRNTGLANSTKAVTAASTQILLPSNASLLARRKLNMVNAREAKHFSSSATSCAAAAGDDHPKGNHPRNPPRSPPPPPPQDAEHVASNAAPGTFLGTTKRLPEFNLVDKVVLVSGAARGLGLTTAEALLEAGATVYALDRLPEPSADFYRVQKRAAHELGSTLYYRQIDVRDVEGLNKVVEEIGNTHGRLDGLVAAAGIQQETTALEYTAKDCNTMMEVNITGVFMTAQAVAKQMIKYGHGGSIAMVASMSATIANRGLICPAYNASKAGVVQLGRNLASEWGSYGIRVNTISPGYIVTAMVEELFVKYPERRTDWPTQNMLQRLSKPEEYRGAAVFLISEASSFMTGADLRIDGGHAAW